MGGVGQGVVEEEKWAHEGGLGWSRRVRVYRVGCGCMGMVWAWVGVSGCRRDHFLPDARWSFPPIRTSCLPPDWLLTTLCILAPR